MTATQGGPDSRVLPVGRISPCRLVDFPRFVDERGCLSVVEGQYLGFEVRRVYYLHDLPDGTARGGHAHVDLEQIVIAVHGSVVISLDDGERRIEHTLDQANVGLYVGPMVWRELHSFKGDAVCVVLASRAYSEGDYLNYYEDFLAAWEDLA